MTRSAILAAIAFILTATAAGAQMSCGPRDIVIERLGEMYGETRRGGGLAGSTAIYEIWASDQPPRTWTILRTTPNGFTCIIAVGNLWRDDTGEMTPTGNPV